MTDGVALIEENVRAFAKREADEAFAVWDQGGDFMVRRAEARAAIDRYAEDQCGSNTDLVARMQAAGFITFIEHHTKRLKQWDAKVALEFDAKERQSNPARRQRSTRGGGATGWC